MRHRISGNRLNRKTSHRKATVRDLAKVTLVRERIRTTKAKAKEARKLVDQLITLGKKGTLADKRRAFAILCDHRLVSELFNQTAARFKNRVGGYTRIIRLGFRRGDNAEMVYLELTEKKELVISKPKSVAEAKQEQLEVTASSSLKGGKKEAKATQVKEPPVSQKDDVKDPSKAGGKEKGGEKFFGGIRKMFKRKSPGGK